MRIEDEESAEVAASQLPFPVVGLGASAGGLEAFRAFFAKMPAAPGMAFVLVQHLDPTHKSVLGELLARFTDMPVTIIEDRMKVEPNRVFLIPPDATLTIVGGILRLEKPAPPRERRTPIDTFFCSLAEDQKENAICIILSGTGSDGALGLRAIKEEGGLTIAQEGGSAKYDGMPRSAVATGLVDHVVAVEGIPSILTSYVEHRNRLDGAKGPGGLHGEAVDHLQQICSVLRARTGHDFRDYKASTIIRRIQRRMQIRCLDDVSQYLDVLRSDGREAPTLLRDLLIGVTHFFRDHQAFEVLEEKVLRRIVAEKKKGEQIRVWVPGCATGEEAYSIAILLHELLATGSDRPPLQIFGTDIDEEALQVARRGLFPDTLAATMPEERLHRFFRPQPGGFQVVDEIRQSCIFSPHSLIKDPPFSKLDLLSCRNLLIYLKIGMQKRLIPIFHYALRPSGFLFLGPSESVSPHAHLFHVVDRKWRILRRRNDVRRPALDLTWMPEPARADLAERGEPVVRHPVASVESAAERLVLDHHAPSFVVIDEERRVIYASGHAARFLEIPAGVPNLDIFNLARPGLRMALRTALHMARTNTGIAARNHLSTTPGEGTALVRITAEVMAEQDDGVRRYLIAFQDFGTLPADTTAGPKNDAVHQTDLEVLESELKATKEYLQTTTEELESSNEELRSSNEELMSMNEELQSANEELETSKEELQSVNEELETVNAELFNKVEEVGRANSDLRNLLESTEIATVFLDRELRIKRFTPMATQIFNLIERDQGRSIADITARIAGVDIADAARKVLDELGTLEREVMLRDGPGTFIMHVLPYRSLSNVIDGVVMTFVDVTRQKQAQDEAELRARQQDAIATLGREGLHGAPSGELIVRATELIKEVLEIDLVEAHTVTPERGSLVRAARAGAGPDMAERIDLEEAAERLELLLIRSGEELVSTDLAAEGRFATPAPLIEHGFRSCFGAIIGDSGASLGLLLGYDRRQRVFSHSEISFVAAMANILANRTRAEEAARRQDLLVAELQHRVKNTLAVVQAMASRYFAGAPAAKEAVEGFGQRIRALARAHELLNRSGWTGVDLRALLVDLVEAFSYGHSQQIDLHASPDLTLTPQQTLSLVMGIHELMANSARHGALAADGGRVDVDWAIEQGDRDRVLEFRWIERGGPAVAPPAHRGFGTEIIESGLKHALGATVEQEFAPEGLRCSIRFALAAR
jgi:two-component system CheB/CheR fusion protein